MANVSNSPVADDYDVVPSIPGPLYDEAVDVFILPRWLCQAFQAKYNLMDILDFSKLREVASLTDIAHLEILRENLFHKSMNSDKGDSAYWEVRSVIYGGYKNRAAVTEKGQQEIDSTISLMVKDPAVIQEALTRLRAPEELRSPGYGEVAIQDNTEYKEEPVPYKVIYSGTALYIIVEEGFLTHIEEKAKRLAFLRQVLKSAYAIAPIPVVNNSMFYQQYLKALV